MTEAFQKASEKSGIEIRAVPLSEAAVKSKKGNSKKRKPKPKDQKRPSLQKMVADFHKKHARAQQRKKAASENPPKKVDDVHTVHIDDATKAQLPKVAVVRGPAKPEKKPKRTPKPPQSTQNKPLRVKDFDRFPLATFTPNSTLQSRVTDKNLHQTSQQCSAEFLGEEQAFVEFKAEMDVTIGIDFGTATTKVVVNAEATRAYAIPFSSNNENSYLISSALSASNDTYSLFGDADDNKMTGLKQSILDGNWDEDRIFPAVAFLGLIINYSRAWFLEHKADEFPGFEFIWHVHIGMPTADYSNKELVRTMERIRYAAEWLSFNSTSFEIAKEDVARAWAQTSSMHFDHFDVYPEIAAQLHGFVFSDRFDRARRKIMLVDIGGGTVDCSIANITEDDFGDVTYHVLATNVQLLGVNSLSEYRLQWLLKSAVADRHAALVSALDKALPNAGVAATVPQKIEDYVNELSSDEFDIDKPFYGDFADLLTDDTLYVARSLDSDHTGYDGLQFVIAGGGSNLDVYNQFIELFNSHVSSYNLVRVGLGKPSDLVAPDLEDSDYHRLSVAYGLANYLLGNYVSPESMKPSTEPFKMPDTALFVSKDLM